MFHLQQVEIQEQWEIGGNTGPVEKGIISFTSTEFRLQTDDSGDGREMDEKGGGGGDRRRQRGEEWVAMDHIVYLFIWV